MSPMLHTHLPEQADYLLWKCITSIKKKKNMGKLLGEEDHDGRWTRVHQHAATRPDGQNGRAASWGSPGSGLGGPSGKTFIERAPKASAARRPGLRLIRRRSCRGSAVATALCFEA